MVNTFKNKLKDIALDMSSTLIELQDVALKGAKQKLDSNEHLLDVEKKIGSFSVKIDDADCAASLLLLADDFGFKIQKGLRYYNEDGTSTLGFFFNEDVDVDFVKDPFDALVENREPVYSAHLDYYKIRRKIREAAEKRDAMISDRADKKVSYRTLYLKRAATIQRVQNGVVGEITGKLPSLEETVKNNKKTKLPHIEVYDHFVQVGNQILPKNPNDCICRLNVIV